MTGDPQEQRKDFLSQLSQNLKNIGEDGFRMLCAEMGKDYDSIAGTDIASKAIAWIREIEDNGLIADLQNIGKENFPRFQWSDPSQQEAIAPLKYYIASDLKPYDIKTKFKIPDNRFERTSNPAEADFLIFDLDNPPRDWIRYVGANFKHALDHENIIFVERQPGQDIDDIQLDGNSIMCLLNKMYKGGYGFRMAKTENEIQVLLSTIENNLRNRMQSNRGVQDQISVQTLASMRRQ